MKIIKNLFLLLAINILFLACASASKDNAELNIINDAKLEELINANAFLVDVRTEEEFEIGAAKNSVNIPKAKIDDHIEHFKGKEHIIVFCRSGVRSNAVKILLEEQHGLINIHNGGTWQRVDKAVRKSKP
jgi:rhodanese-related sulfurtransferase